MWFLLVACSEPSSESTPVQKDSTPAAFYQYFTGQSVTTSPDGSRVYAENSVLVRRLVDPPNAEIVEETWYDTDARVTTMVRQGETDVFDASDNLGSFQGTITYTGPEWEWTGWTYDIQMLDGSGHLDGTGSTDGQTWQSQKTFYGTNDQPQAVVEDTLQMTDEAGFNAELPAHTGS